MASKSQYFRANVIQKYLLRLIFSAPAADWCPRGRRKRPRPHFHRFSPVLASILMDFFHLIQFLELGIKNWEGFLIPNSRTWY